MSLLYVITSASDKEGNKKDIPLEWLEDKYDIGFLKEGRSAILYMSKQEGKVLRTSTVEDIMIHENNIKITTMNTIYYLSPVIN